MGRRVFNAEEHIKAVNKFRLAMNGGKFTKEQILDVFKKDGIQSKKHFWDKFKKSVIIKKVGQNEYIFASDQPIHYAALGKVYREYQAVVKKYKKTRTEPETSKPESKQDESEASNPEEDLLAIETFAVDFLKELGYKILAPVGIVYQPV